jgi:hypothetical protein
MINFQLSRDNITKFFPVFILGCFIAAYWAGFYKMSIRWSGGDNNYCYLVIPLFAYLLWDRRYMLRKGLRLPSGILLEEGSRAAFHGASKAQGSRQIEDENGEELTEQVRTI